VARVYSYNLDRGGNAVSSDNYRCHATADLQQGYRAEPQVDDNSASDLSSAFNYSERMNLHRANRDLDRARRACTEFAGSSGYSNYSNAKQSENTSELHRSEQRSQLTELHRSEQRSQLTNLLDKSAVQADVTLNNHRQTMFDLENSPYIRKSNLLRENDDICKRVADIRMTPWRGDEMQQEYQAAQQSRARLTSLNRELDNITRSNMKYRSSYNKTAAQLAKEALQANRSSSVYKKTRKVVTQSSA